jgi:hypothetical protein
MKRFLASALVLGSFSLFTLTGCDDTSKVEQKETVKTPEGSTTTTKTEKVESSGSTPPANSSGETGMAAAPM